MPTADPVGYTGWGHESFAIAKKLKIEALEEEKNLKKFGEAAFSKPPLTSSDAEMAFVINLIKEKYSPWDAGFDMTWCEKEVYGGIQWRGPQNCGNCVGASHCVGLAQRVAAEVLIEGDPEVVLGDSNSSPIPYIPYSYGAGRCLSGNMCGRYDGSYCGSQFAASQEHGFVPSNTEGLQGPFPQPSSQIVRKFGSSRTILNNWRSKAIKFDLLHSFRVRTPEEVWEAVVDDFMPIQICSNWGFKPTNTKIQGDGITYTLYRPGGSWAHSMLIEAAFEYKGSRFCKVSNQWGVHAHRDGYFFIVDFDDLERWLKQADARAIGEIQGKPYALAA